jgi:hypothetical protein
MSFDHNVPLTDVSPGSADPAKSMLLDVGYSEHLTSSDGIGSIFLTQQEQEISVMRRAIGEAFSRRRPVERLKSDPGFARDRRFRFANTAAATARGWPVDLA